MFKNMKIGVRLAIGFCATLALLIIVAGIGMARINQISGDIRALVQDDFPKTVLANEMVEALGVNARILRNAYIFKGAEAQKELDRLPEQSRIISESLAKLEQMITTDASAGWTGIETTWQSEASIVLCPAQAMFENSTPAGSWRFTWDQFTPEKQLRVRTLTAKTGRL